ncbi:hypothetical protein RND81_11G235600 [Saponaria officinalis]|uniref:Dof zinc finger protein n=1 Tax=Saponaria officinalis TaxID=3572 RepID=A0AAW1HQZ1_SAPOF
MSPENIPPSPENHATSKKTTTPKPPHEQPLKCPRCDSSNTKFCYYNNYSLTQPRHFCKTCRRYWTRGGALRSVPIGGGCRKTNKRLKTTATCTASTTTSVSAKLFGGGGGGGEFGPGFKFLNPGSNPATEFNLGGLSPPRLHPATAGVYTQFITSSVPVTGCGPAYFGLDLIGLNNHSTSTSVTSTLVQCNNNEHQNSISTIESLSSINQEMHWKLQQQRLGFIYEENNKNNDQEKSIGGINLFNNLEINNNNNNNNNDNLHGVWGDLHNHNNQQQLQFHGLQ